MLQIEAKFILGYSIITFLVNIAKCLSNGLPLELDLVDNCLFERFIHQLASCLFFAFFVDFLIIRISGLFERRILD
jgi:hypothetical protein